ncbi:MAG: hypothetical protein COA43_05855 [Robiginitomaculum sp.]|nr:MAG: hypothetical protein COA43_05855 [Robiginitomaculum sp.]
MRILRWVVLGFCIGSVLIGRSAVAQTTTSNEVQKLVDHLTRTQPDLTKDYEVSKKKFEEWEKKTGKNADKYAQNSFDKVFGKDKLKPSDALGYLEVAEAIYAGDYEYAGKTLEGMLVKCPESKLGCFIKAMKEVKAIGVKTIKKWEDEIYQTQSFKYFRYDLGHLTKYEEMIKDTPNYEAYVPSYMVSSLRNNQHIGAEMKALYGAMLAREQLILNTWSGEAGGRLVSVTAKEKEFNSILSREEAYNVLLWGEGWLNPQKGRKWYEFSSTRAMAAKWRSKLGFAPGDKNTNAERAIFNHFLHILTAPKKDDYMLTLTVYYIDPIIKREAKKEQKRIDDATAASVRATMAAINSAIQKEQKNEEQKKAEQEAEYKEYIRIGVVEKTLILPLNMSEGQAFNIGIQAVERGQDFYTAIDRLSAEAREQQKERNGKANERLEDEAVQEKAFVEDVATEDVSEEGAQEENIQKESTEDWVEVNEDDSQFVDPYVETGGDINSHVITEDSIIADLIASDKRGELTPEAQKEYEDLLEKGYAAEATQNADVEEDNWGNVDDIDANVSANYTQEELWAMRVELANKSIDDAQRSDERANNKFAAIEMQREEEQRIKAEKARKFRENLAALAQGFGEVAAQIEQEKAQSVYNNAQIQNAAQEVPNNAFGEPVNRKKFMNACTSKFNNSSPGFRNLDPHAAMITCGNKYSTQKRNPKSNAGGYTTPRKPSKQVTYKPLDRGNQTCAQKSTGTKNPRRWTACCQKKGEMRYNSFTVIGGTRRGASAYRCMMLGKPDEVKYRINID